MATTVIRFTNNFSDDTKGTVTVGPIESTVVNLANIRTQVKAFNERIADTDTGVNKLMQGQYGGDWQNIGEVRLTTTTITYIS